MWKGHVPEGKAKTPNNPRARLLVQERDDMFLRHLQQCPTAPHDICQQVPMEI